jgi:hypothetical protein
MQRSHHLVSIAVPTHGFGALVDSGTASPVSDARRPDRTRSRPTTPEGQGGQRSRRCDRLVAAEQPEIERNNAKSVCQGRKRRNITG